MVTYKEQREFFITTLEKLKSIVLKIENEEELITVHIPTWSEKSAVPFFPSRIEIIFEIPAVSKAEIMLYANDDWKKWNKISIIKVDTKEAFQKQGNGRRLLNAVKRLAHELNVPYISGTILKKEGYSSEEFYQKCGFKTDGSKFELYMDT